MKKVSKWQIAYDFFRNWKPPTTLKMLINIAWGALKQIPKISTIAMRAFEVSKAVDKESIAGYLKKRKVISEINKILKEFDTELPTTIKNLINELVALATKLLYGKK